MARGDGNGTGALSLGSSGFLAAISVLTCGGVVLEPWPQPRPVPGVPHDSRRIWHANGTAPSVPSILGGRWALECLSPSRRQSATVAGASTDQARVCLATPTGLSHAAGAVDRRKPRRPGRRVLGGVVGGRAVGMARRHGACPPHSAKDSIFRRSVLISAGISSDLAALATLSKETALYFRFCNS